MDGLTDGWNLEGGYSLDMVNSFHLLCRGGGYAHMRVSLTNSQCHCGALYMNASAQSHSYICKMG